MNLSEGPYARLSPSQLQSVGSAAGTATLLAQWTPGRHSCLHSWRSCQVLHSSPSCSLQAALLAPRPGGRHVHASGDSERALFWAPAPPATVKDQSSLPRDLARDTPSHASRTRSIELSLDYGIWNSPGDQF